jgi:RIO-like serine/threonine protein kinase
MTFQSNVPMSLDHAVLAVNAFKFIRAGKKNYARVFSERRKISRKIKFAYMPRKDVERLAKLYREFNIPFYFTWEHYIAINVPTQVTMRQS